MIPGTSPLGRHAKALRAAHVAVAVVELTSLAYVWACAVRRRRGRFLGLAVGALALEGAGLVVGRGDCPLGPLQESVGDPVPLFELVLPPRAAKAAVPVLTAVTFGGLAALAVRTSGRGDATEPGRKGAGGGPVEQPQRAVPA